jgi:hypothetical protein
VKKYINTPHVRDVEKQTNPLTGETFTITKRTPRPATQEDIDKVKKMLND